MEQLSDIFEGISKPLTLLIAFTISIVLAVIYALIGAPLAFAIFFILPTAFVAFCAGNNAGVAMAIFNMIAWLLADLLKSRETIQLWIPLVNAVFNLGLFLLVVYAVD